MNTNSETRGKFYYRVNFGSEEIIINNLEELEESKKKFPGQTIVKIKQVKYDEEFLSEDGIVKEFDELEYMVNIARWSVFGMTEVFDGDLADRYMSMMGYVDNMMAKLKSIDDKLSEQFRFVL